MVLLQYTLETKQIELWDRVPEFWVAVRAHPLLVGHDPGALPSVVRVHSSAVEHWIADPMVTGSIPVVPSFGAVMQGSLRLVYRS